MRSTFPVLSILLEYLSSSSSTRNDCVTYILSWVEYAMTPVARRYS